MEPRRRIKGPSHFPLKQEESCSARPRGGHVPTTPRAGRAPPPRGGAMRGAAGTMAWAGGSLGFLAWLLLFQTRLTEAQEARAGTQAPPSPSPFLSEGHNRDPRASWWELLAPGFSRSLSTPKTGENNLSLLAFDSGACQRGGPGVLWGGMVRDRGRVCSVTRGLRSGKLLWGSRAGPPLGHLGWSAGHRGARACYP